MAIETNWFVVTGAPCSGKTTVLKLLTQNGYKFTPDAARIFIEGLAEMGVKLEEMRKDPAEFQRLVAGIRRRTEDELTQDSIVFLDRAVPDSLTYYRSYNLDPHPEVVEASTKYRYKAVFVFDRLSHIEYDGVRVEEIERQKYLDRELELEYQKLGYDTIRVPVCDPAERCEILLSHLKKCGLKLLQPKG